MSAPTKATGIENVHTLARMLDALEHCQFPDAECCKPSTSGLGGYCDDHIGEMRRRASVELANRWA